MRRCLSAPCWAGIVLALYASEMPAGVTADRLYCEYATNPLGIDVQRPRFSWTLEADRRAEVQTAYQILVAGSEGKLAAGEGDLWNSGKVESDQSVNVVYGGRPLPSGTRAYWKVRAWDRDGSVSPYSEAAWWETGRAGPKDWSARWIAADESKSFGADLALGNWIWNAKVIGEGKSAFFRRHVEIELSQPVQAALIKVNADNFFELYVNGRFVDRCIFWNMPRGYDVTPDLRPGRNVIAIKAINGIDPPGLRVAVRLRLADGSAVEFQGDGEWMTCAEPKPGWEQADFDDSGWDRAVIVPSDQAERWKEIKEPFGPPVSQCVRKEFSLKDGIIRARAYVSGLGLYELEINGRRVGQDVFTPGWTDYHKRVQYQVYDVTDLLRSGSNAVGAILGNGWFAGDLGWAQRPPFSQGPLRFLLQLDVEYADGARDRLVSDESWQSHPSPIVRNTFWQGETYDSRLEMPGWSEPGFDSSAWTPVRVVDAPSGASLVAQCDEAIRVVEELAAVKITEPAKGVFVFDFGQNAAGWARLKVRGSRGSQVRLRFAEILKADGHIDQANLRKAEATDYYVLKGEGEEEVWEPRFTYHGFRYCELTGYEGQPASDALTFRVVHSAAPVAGRFECSDELLNRIWRNVTWGQRSNMHSVWTDCPQRDERLGWTGDVTAMAPTACWNMQMCRFFSKWMQDLRDSQGKDGGVPDIVPNLFGSGAGAPGWSDAAIVLPWTLYLHYGDTRVIEENYGLMAGWVEYMRGRSKNHLYEVGGYGDWVAPVESPKEPVGSAYYYYSTSLLAQMAAVIGKTDDAAKYSQLAAEIANAFNRAYYDESTSSYRGNTQTANILPLAFGLVPEQHQPGVMRSLVRDITDRGSHLSTGFVGTAYLMPALARFGQHEVAYKLVTQRSYPSWGYMIDHGATTMWELWDADRKGPEMNSRNHAALGAVGRWFYEVLAGINIDPHHPGFKHVIIRPTPVGDLKRAQASYASVRGDIISQWQIEDGRFQLTVTIPVNCSATVFLPTSNAGNVLESNLPVGEKPGVTLIGVEDGKVACRIGSGEYCFTCDCEKPTGSRPE